MQRVSPVRFTRSVYPPPAQELSNATVIQLDDQFFTSDPFAYIRGRVRALLSDEQPVGKGPLSGEFSRLLGPSARLYLERDAQSAATRVALDAFALRHHVAESLVRLLYVLLHHAPGQSRWVELVDAPLRNRDVLRANSAVLKAQDDSGKAMLTAALRGSAPAGNRLSAAQSGVDSSDVEGIQHPSEHEWAQSLDTHLSWLNYAIALLTQPSPDLNAAHNKFKHGMGIRPQHDVLTTLMLDPPNPDGSVNLSSMLGQRAMTIFDGVTVEYLSRASRRSGLEATQLSMSPAPTLVETAAMAHTLSLLFHNAAVSHFVGRAPRAGRTIPSHPGILVNGPRPGRMRGRRPFALRFPLTTPVREGGDGLAEMFWTDGTVNTLSFGERTTATIVDGTSDSGDGQA